MPDNSLSDLSANWPTIFELASQIPQVTRGSTNKYAAPVTQGLIPQPFPVMPGYREIPPEQIASLRVPTIEVGVEIKGFQREKVNAHARKVARAMEAGEEMPPIIVSIFPDGNAYVDDGQHRALGALIARKKLEVVVKHRTVDQARKLFANQGKARTLRSDDTLSDRRFAPGAVPPGRAHKRRPSLVRPHRPQPLVVHSHDAHNGSADHRLLRLQLLRGDLLAHSSRESRREAGRSARWSAEGVRQHGDESSGLQGPDAPCHRLCGGLDLPTQSRRQGRRRRALDDPHAQVRLRQVPPSARQGAGDGAHDGRALEQAASGRAQDQALPAHEGAS
jgi:hypothetical protein